MRASGLGRAGWDRLRKKCTAAAVVNNLRLPLSVQRPNDQVQARVTPLNAKTPENRGLGRGANQLDEAVRYIIK